MSIANPVTMISTLLTQYVEAGCVCYKNVNRLSYLMD